MVLVQASIREKYYTRVFDHGTSVWVSRYITHASLMILYIMAYWSVMTEKMPSGSLKMVNNQRILLSARRFAQFPIGI